MLIDSEPQGAVVFVDGNERGTTPARVAFEFYGTHEFVLKKKGYHTLTVREKVEPPIYQVFPLDFVSELLLPVKFEDEHAFCYMLTEYTVTDPDELVARARELETQLDDPASCAQPCECE
jgi:hypothetical protein